MKLLAMWRRGETDSAERDTAAMLGRAEAQADRAIAAAELRATIPATDPGYAEAIAYRLARFRD